VTIRQGPGIADVPSATTSSATTAPTKVPGEPGVWVLIFGDMLAFAALFGVFMYYQRANPVVFDQSRTHLEIWRGVLNTLLLLTSSYFVVLALSAFRNGPHGKASRLLVAAFTCGGGFVINKVLEYRTETAGGNTPTTNLFYTFFYTMTGIHLVHLVIGMCGLGVMWRVAQRAENSGRNPDKPVLMEVCAVYWHMVDLLWVIIFPLLYLMR
jgi:nitric oxide reductase NorE protein